MAYTLTQTINWAATFIQYSPQTAGLGQEPAVSTASAIRNLMLSPPLTWAWNRNEDSSTTTVAGTQDYTISLTDFGFLEKASLTDATGKVTELKYVHNLDPLSKSSDQQRPNEVAILQSTSFTSIKVRFMGVPDAAYTINLTYQKGVPLLGPYLISSCGTASGGNTTYTGLFDPISFPTGQTASVTGFITNPANNGVFTIVSVTATQLVLANPSGVAETPSLGAFVSNFNWSPLPDEFMFIYNQLYLGEILAMADDPRSQTYRQRGMANLLSKSEGLSETQKNAMMQQWVADGLAFSSSTMRSQLGHQSRLV